MSKPFSPTRPDTSQMEQRVDQLRASLQGKDPAALADRTGASYHATQHEFRLAVWGRESVLTYPGWTARDLEKGHSLSAFHLALLLYYFVTADGTPLTGQWVSFADLPDGRFYNQAFQGYSGKELGRVFGNDQNAFEKAAQAAGGVPLSLGDAGFAFQILPRLPVAVVYWQGDDEFPASVQVLFDGSASHYLPTDVCAIQGGTLARRIISQRQSIE